MNVNACCVSPSETSAEPSLQAKQLQLKRARLADDLNDKISHRPGPIELVHKNILSVDLPVGSPLGNYTHNIAQRLTVQHVHTVNQNQKQVYCQVGSHMRGM